MTITINRGKLNIIEFVIPGDQTQNKLKFVICDSDLITASILVEKNNVLNDGSEDEISTELIKEGTHTKINIFIMPSETNAFSGDSKTFGIDSIDVNNANLINSLQHGLVRVNKLQPNNFNGFLVPEENIQYQIVNAEDGGVGDILMINDSGKVEFTSLAQLKILLDGLV
jgi:hypothetical protein